MSPAPLVGTMRVRRGKRTAARVVGNRAVVIAIDNDRLHTLNFTGAAIWEQCDGRSLDELITWFGNEYHLEFDQAAHDVRHFVQDLRALGVLDVEEGE